MTAICPRCGTVSLAGSHETHFVCKTCHLRFCIECRYWKDERKQSYCAKCGSLYNLPPPVMPDRLMYIMFLASFAAAIVFSAFGRTHPWQIAAVAIAPSVIYTSLYLWVFKLRTQLARATWREVIFFIRRTLTLATLAYIAFLPNSQMTIPVSLVMIVVLLFIGLAGRRLDSAVNQELRNHRPTWAALLSMRNWDACLMRFPDVRASEITR
jgi:hypothetical protein